MAEGLAARQAAVAILGAVLGERRLLAEVLADPAGPQAPLAPADRARAQRLALMVLRHLDQADHVLTPLMRKPPPRLARDALRLAVCEMAVEGAAAHGAVNAAVEIVRRGRRTGHLAGLVNAVLRQVAALPDPFAGLPPQRLPQWLRPPLVRAWGRPVVAAIEAVQAAPPPVDLTLRPGAAPPPGAVALPTGSWRLAAAGQISALPGYDAGDFWVQDAAAALAVPILAPRPAEVVADLCAAPGGKTLQLAAAGARVWAVDASDRRLDRLRRNLARTGLTARVVAADALDWQPPEPPDAILLDAPCSATGTIRRHPDLPFVKSAADLPGLIALQARLIDRAVALLRPGGRLVFCTCSLLPEEGEAQLDAALARHPALRVEPPQAPGIDPAWITPQGGLRLRPDLWADRGGMDGFFIARMRLT